MFSNNLIYAFIIGILSHLIGDFLTKQGIELFYPITDKNYRFPINISSGGIIEYIISFILVFAIAWLLRRVGGVSLTGGGALKVISGMSMGARERVVLLQVGEEQLLLGISPGRVQTLHVLEKPIEVEQPAMGTSMFANKLAEVLKSKKK